MELSILLLTLIPISIMTILIIIVSHNKTKETFGKEIAQRNLRSILPMMLVILVLSGLFLLLGKNAVAGFSVLSMIIVLISYFRRPSLGELLLDMGKTEQYKSLFWLGIAEIVLLHRSLKHFHAGFKGNPVE
jgi:Na+/H+ antiporter NhaC